MISRIPDPAEPVPAVAAPTVALLVASLALWISSPILWLAGLLPWWVTVTVNAVASYMAFTVAHDGATAGRPS